MNLPQGLKEIEDRLISLAKSHTHFEKREGKMHPPTKQRAMMLLALVAALHTSGNAASSVPTLAPSAIPSPSSAPAAESPAPASTPIPLGWRLYLSGETSLVDQATNGSGTQPPEGALFAAGNPLSPMTPYDTFSSAPTTPGIAGVGEVLFNEIYGGKHLNGSILTGITYVDGSTTNAVYWTESLMPTINPHLGSRALPYSVAFPIHAGQDDGRTVRGSVLSGTLSANDSSWTLKGGWFDLTQSDHFVFAQPPLTSVTPALLVQTAETLGNGSPAIDGWPSPPPGLPLHGGDLTLRRGIATAELTDAAVPSLQGTGARVTIASVVLDHGEGTRWSSEFLHLTTGGNDISTTTLYGANAVLTPSPQGMLPTSDLGGQRSTIVGLRGAFHLTHAIDATLEAGHTWYDADHVLEPGTNEPGNFYHAGLSRSIGRVTANLDAYRWGPRYASAILPYGIPENIWSVAWSWPGIWLKSNYQLADNTVVGANREGYRVRYAVDRGALEIHTSFDEFHQIRPSAIPLSNQVGFVEGFFLPQQPAFTTLGKQKQLAAWVAWHPSFGDLSFDYVDDMMHRDAAPSQPQDAVSLDAPQAVLSYARSINKSTIVAIGAGRFAMQGSFSHGSFTNVDYRQNVVFAAGQFAETRNAMVLVQWRHHAFSGSPSIIGGPSPDFTGSIIALEQRFHL